MFLNEMEAALSGPWYCRMYQSPQECLAEILARMVVTPAALERREVVEILSDAISEMSYIEYGPEYVDNVDRQVECQDDILDRCVSRLNGALGGIFPDHYIGEERDDDCEDRNAPWVGLYPEEWLRAKLSEYGYRSLYWAG